MKRAILSSALLLAASALAACAGNDGKREPGVSTAPTLDDPPRQAESNPTAPGDNPNAPINESESPEDNPTEPVLNPNLPPDPGTSPGPSPTSSGGPGPGGPPIDCSGLCADFTGECASACQQACAPYNGRQFPCREELEDMLGCYLDLCESGGQSGTCEGELASLNACASEFQQ